MIKKVVLAVITAVGLTMATLWVCGLIGSKAEWVGLASFLIGAFWGFLSMAFWDSILED